MTQKTKKKLCWNCEGRTSLQDENCPFCGVYLSPLSVGDNSGNENSLFAPPYQMTNEEENEIPHSPFSQTENDDDDEKDVSKNRPHHLVNQFQEDNDEMKSIIAPTVLLSGGVMVLLFGVVLSLFSENGILTLHWDATYWPIYIVISLVMLFFGWKALESIKPPESSS